MKKLILASLILSATSAFAGEFCGTLTTYTTAPFCAPGGACSHMIRLVYALQTENVRYDLETGSEEVLEKLGESKGKNVCVTATERPEHGDVLEVTAVTERD